MTAVQRPLALPQPGAARPRLRFLRRPFTPARGDGPYRLPRDVEEWLATALAPARNRDAAFALAVFLARHWSSPGRIAGAFPVDRRALADHRDLGLTEARVRGALRVLEEVGFLVRGLPARGNGFQRTAGGELRRKPVTYIFGPDFAPVFLKANQRAQAARARRSGEQRATPSPSSSRPSVPTPKASYPISPRVKEPEVPQVYLGELVRRPPPEPTPPNTALECALDKLLRGIRQSRG